MSDQNKLGKRTVSDNVDDNGGHASEYKHEGQQVSVQAWAQKILVVLLCVGSFYAGWKSHESNVVNHCVASGGQMIEHNKTLICQI